MPRKKVLIVKLGALGDIAMASSLLLELKDKEVSWLCHHSYTPLLKRFSLIDSVLSCDHDRLLRGNFLEKIKEVIKIWGKIGLRFFDEVIVAHKDSRYKWLTAFTLKKKQYAFHPLSLFPLGEFHSKEYLKLIGLAKEPKYPPIIINKKKYDHLKKPLIALNLSSDEKMDLRKWPKSFYLSLAKELSIFANVILVGTSKEPIPSTNDYLCFVNKTSLEELMDLLGQCLAFVTHDSGLLHIARLLKVPTLALFGPTNPSHFSNFSTEKALYKKIACSFCYDGKKFAHCKNPICLSSLSVDYVLKNLLLFIKSHENRTSP